MFSFLCTLIWSVMNQIGIRFYIPLESTCYLFVAYCHEFFNRKSYDGFVVPVERELQKPPIWLNNHWKKLREFVLFIKLFVTQRWRFWRIRSNVLRGTESDLAYTIHFMVWKLMVYPVRSSILKFFH